MYLAKYENKTTVIIMVVIITILLVLSGISAYNYVNNSNILSDEITIRINEYQMHNKNTLRNSTWDTYDWIELYNYGEEDVWLGDVYLSDDNDNLQKYNLPNIAIEAGSYLIIYASSAADNIDNEIHANFKIGQGDEYIFVSSQNNIIDSRKIVEMSEDISAGINEDDKWMYFATPTPGKENVGNGVNDQFVKAIPKETVPLIISEYMSLNKYTIKDCFGESSDWIELYNPNDFSVNLNDYYISDDISKCGKYRLPDYELAPYEYKIIYASGEIFADEMGVHVPFSIGQYDENIIISSCSGVQVDICDVEPLPDDISAGLYDDTWVYFSTPTPGEENSSKVSKTYDIIPDRISESPLVINEVMPNNQYGILDADGDSSDWVEIYNPTNKDISLDGYALSDDESELDKWLFPEDVSIEAESYILVFLSDKVKKGDEELHANFALGSDDSKIMLIDVNGAVVSYIDIEDMPGNVSKGLTDSNTYGYFTLPTPNEKNTGHYEEELKGDEDFLLTDIYISEVSVGHISFNRNMEYEFQEFIEISNGGDNSVNLSGYTIDIDGDETWTFPDVLLEPNRYITLQLKGNAEEKYNVINVPLSISSKGEKLLIKNSAGTIIDCFETGFLTGDVSSGRVIAEGSSRYFFTEKTPNRKNSSNYVESYCSIPIFSQDGGMVEEESVLLALSCPNGQEIRYTTDGKNPTENSKKYTEPILLDKDIVIKAACFADGKLPSITVSRTFIFEREHDLPIVCLSTSPVFLFGDSCGIFANGPGYVGTEPPHIGANYWKNWECEINFEYYDEDNQLGLNFEAGMQVAGQYSRVYDQKSIVIRLRDEYGLNEVYFPFFEDSDVDEFKHILLRSSGQDIGYSKIKDYFIHQSVKDYSDVDIMEGRPVAVYINGQYWGLYNLREKQNEDYLASHYNIDRDDVTIIKNINDVLAGDIKEWNDLIKFIENNDFSGDEMFAELEEKVDVDRITDYIIIQSFYGNYDMGNIKYWKGANGKWRPFLYDTDMALVKETSHINYLQNYFIQSDYTFLICALFENDGFRDEFVERYAFFLNQVFTEEKLLSLVDELAHEIDKEIVYQTKRFHAPQSYDKWMGNIEEMKETILARRYSSVEHLKSVFDLSDTEIERLFDWY